MARMGLDHLIYHLILDFLLRMHYFYCAEYKVCGRETAKF